MKQSSYKIFKDIFSKIKIKIFKLTSLGIPKNSWPKNCMPSTGNYH